MPIVTCPRVPKESSRTPRSIRRLGRRRRCPRAARQQTVRDRGRAAGTRRRWPAMTPTAPMRTRHFRWRLGNDTDPHVDTLTAVPISRPAHGAPQERALRQVAQGTAAQVHAAGPDGQPRSRSHPRGRQTGSPTRAAPADARCNRAATVPPSGPSTPRATDRSRGACRSQSWRDARRARGRRSRPGSDAAPATRCSRPAERGSSRTRSAATGTRRFTDAAPGPGAPGESSFSTQWAGTTTSGPARVSRTACSWSITCTSRR
jgi:hypothetical protein